MLVTIALVAVGALLARAANEAGRGGAVGGDGRRYRPHGRTRAHGAGADPFRPDQGGAKATRSVIRRSALAQLRDGLSGAALSADDDLFRCAGCQSFYTAASVRALANENSARCLHCGSFDRLNVEVID